MISKEQKINREKQMVTKMITIYCNRHHQEPLCVECASLLEYAIARIERCPKMETKTFCSQCTIHCYAQEKQERIKTVMRYSGPRILFYHPIVAIRHMFLKRRNIRD